MRPLGSKYHDTTSCVSLYLPLPPSYLSDSSSSLCVLLSSRRQCRRQSKFLPALPNAAILHPLLHPDLLYRRPHTTLHSPTTPLRSLLSASASASCVCVSPASASAHASICVPPALPPRASPPPLSLPCCAHHPRPVSHPPASPPDARPAASCTQVFSQTQCFNCCSSS